MAPIKQFWDDGKLAIVHGVGWKESPRSHFRAMTSGTPASRSRSAPRDGSAASPASLTRKKKTS
jgi:uncharacterized protein (DUF1501 family)